MTGRSLLRFGLVGTIIDHAGLPLDETTSGEVIREARYQTWSTGKWRIGYGKRASGLCTLPMPIPTEPITWLSSVPRV